MMQVRVKQGARWKNLTACAGMEFVKFEYRPVPRQFEAEAARNPFLEIKPEPNTEVEPDVIQPEPQEVKDLEIPKAETPKPAKRGKK